MKKIIAIALILFIFKAISLTNTKYTDNIHTESNIPHSTPQQKSIISSKVKIQEKPKPTITKKAMPIANTNKKQISFKCDHRKHCSQMRSYEEAKYFLQNCSGVKMDGDYDGIPCEMQFRKYY